MTQRVPSFDGAREFAAHAAELEVAALRVLRSGNYILGPEVEMFERECAEYIEVGHAIGVGNGTDALQLALRASGVGLGDRVLTASFTFFATVSAIIAVGAEPVFADIDPASYCLDPASCLRTMQDGSPVKAIVPVHLYGQPADMTAIGALASDAGAVVIEDAAQAIGATGDGRKAGAFGAAGCFSFFPTKNLGAFGDGGMITTDDPDLANRVRMLRAHGARAKYEHEIVGTNSRLDALQAAMLRVRLRSLDGAVERRNAIADRYDELLSDAAVVPTRIAGRRHAFHQYVVRVPRRDDVRKAMADAGIGTGVYYAIPAHLQRAIAGRSEPTNRLPETERAAAEVLALPIFPTMTDDEVALVAKALMEAIGSLA